MKKFIIIIVIIITLILFINNYYKTNLKVKEIIYKEYNIGDIVLIDNKRWLVIEDSNEKTNYIKILGIDGIPSQTSTFISYNCNNNNLDELLKDITNYINALNISLKEETNVSLLSMEDLFNLTEYEERKHNNELYNLFNDYYFYYLHIEDKPYLKEINTILSNKVTWVNEYNNSLITLKEEILKNNNTYYYDIIDEKIVYKNIPSVCNYWNSKYLNDTLIISSETYNNEIKIQPIINILKNSL